MEYEKEYWESILGPEVFQMLMERKQRTQYMREEGYGTGKYKNSNFIERINQKQFYGNYESWFTSESIFFSEFYFPFCLYAIEELKQRTIRSRQHVADKVYEQFGKQVAMHLQTICIRTLIVEMHTYKEKGLLIQGTPEEEYYFFCEVCVKKRKFLTDMMEKYPAFIWCIEERINRLVDFYTEVIGRFKRDKGKICEMFNTQEIEYIAEICSTASDLHNQGRQVLKIELNNGATVLYKPHSMENEYQYMRLLEWIAGKTGIEQYSYPFLSFQEYSWCSVVSHDCCYTEEELRRYYKRLGSQLFLVYLLGTKDLHSENVIAHGEYPVLIDLETLVNIQYNQDRKTAYQEICYQLTNSVLYTGLLPFYYFNQDGKGINASAISGAGGQKYPFKIPTIIRGKTSDMKIVYRHPESIQAQNLAMLDKEFITPARFEKDLISGFQDTYYCVMKNRETFRNELYQLRHSASRYLVLDTQRYSMLLSTSYHPSFLMDRVNREMFLYSLWKGRMNEREDVVESEIKSLLQGDIPYFWYQLDDVDLIVSSGKRIKHYFSEVPIDIIFKKLDALNLEDMRRQGEYIKMSLQLMPDNIKRFENKCYKVGKPNQMHKRHNKQIHDAINILMERLIKYAVWNSDRTEVSWFTVQLSSFGKPTWEIRPMNMYLYNGLAGMLLITYELQKRKMQEVQELYHTICRMLFTYTDFMYEKAGKNHVKNTGMYDGEASVLYTYYLLYTNGGGDKYLDYARKHASVVEHLLEYDQKYDLLMGNAGAAMALIYLYEITNEREYLLSAEWAVEFLERNAVECRGGIGWITEDGIPPFAGVAHGNSGILMPITALWRYTGNHKYKLLIEKVLKYEDVLFDEGIQNWTDVRGNIPEDEHGAIAWCHGVGGILLSRVICYEIINDERLKKKLKSDIIAAYRKLIAYWRRDSWCLCHGCCGNLWILEQTKNVVEKIVGKVEIPSIFTDNNKVSLLIQEQLNPGLMNGYGGILLYLLCLKS